MRFPHHARIFRGQPDAAPFLGVFMLLLIFLLLHSSLVSIPGVHIQLPEAVALPGADTPTVAVAVDKSGQCYFDNQVCGEERLREKLKQAAAEAREGLTLVVQADKDVRYEVLVRLGLLARSAGVKEAILATRPLATPTVAPPQP
jgi:biopolymer transport protein ExbD